MRLRRVIALLIAWLLAAGAARAADFPAPQEGTWTAKDFRFASGETLAELRIGYLTIGAPTGRPVLVLPGTGQAARGLTGPAFGGELFGPGQPLDVTKWFVIIPDALGNGRSSKPSDGLRGSFPRYTYDDIVSAQHRLVTEGLGIRRLDLILGYSLGGMNAWLWAVRHPDAVAAIVPLASQPVALSGRNWLMRKLMIETIRRDPAYADGSYTQQPASLRTAALFYTLGETQGRVAVQARAPSQRAGDQIVETLLSQTLSIDANDFVYQFDAGRDYDPSGSLDRVRARVLSIVSTDDDVVSLSSGLLEAALAKLPDARLVKIPGGPQTTGHGTTLNARLWTSELKAFLGD